MTDATLILGLAVLAATAGVLSACLRLRGVTEFLLAAYVIAFAEVVVIALALSPAHLLTRTAVLACLGGALAAALAAWQIAGRPSPPPARGAVSALREALGDPVLAVLAVVVVGALGYSAALALATPPNDYDALWYHAARAAFWKQQHAVAYVHLANDRRIDVFPPNAEIAVAFAMILARSERYVGLVQLVALLATLLGIFGVARRLGLGCRQALFGALAFATLPVVALQASTALNDLVVTSLLTAVVFFLFSYTGTSLALAALALGLAVGTKATAVFALPVLAVVAALLHPARRWPALALAGTAGVALGSYWWLLNLVKTGTLHGEFARGAARPAPEHESQVVSFAARLARYAIDTVDPSGAVGSDRWVYAIAAAAVLAGGGLLAVRRRSRRLLTASLVAAVLVLLPLVVRPAYDILVRGYQKAWLELGYRRLAFLGFDKHPTRASPFQSWYGTLGLALFLVALPLVHREVRRRTVPRAALGLALAPLVFLVVLAAGTQYSLWTGRYLMLAVALAAATWGTILRLRPVAWAAAALGAATVLLAFVHYDEKPGGVDVLGSPAAASVWSEQHWQVESRFLPRGASEVLRALEERARPGETVGLRIRQNDVSYPYFGGRLDRRILFIGDEGGGLAGADWLVLAPGKRVELCPPDWARAAATEGWRLYRRVGRARCGQRHEFPLPRRARRCYERAARLQPSGLTRCRSGFPGAT